MEALTMIEWSDTELMIRDAVRAFVDKEVRPHVEALESGELPPYDIIRKLYSSFGVGAMAEDALRKSLAKERAREEAKAAGEAPPEQKAEQKAAQKAGK
jgi:hypothetical protein